MAAKQDDLVAGSNIPNSPDGKTISATDTTYTAGTGLTLTDTEFSADTTVLATQTDLTTALASKLEAEGGGRITITGIEGKLYLEGAYDPDRNKGNLSRQPWQKKQALRASSWMAIHSSRAYTGKNLPFSSQGNTGTYCFDA